MEKEYDRELENYGKLWGVFARNCLAPDFRRSLYSVLGLAFVPTAVNVYYIFRVSYLANLVGRAA